MASTDKPVAQTTRWRRFRDRETGKEFRARWEPDAQLPEGGAWEPDDGLPGYVHPDEAAEKWEAVDD